MIWACLKQKGLLGSLGQAWFTTTVTSHEAARGTLKTQLSKSDPWLFQFTTELNGCLVHIVCRIPSEIL